MSEAQAAEKAETRVVAGVQVEIRQEDGKVIKDAFTVDWDEDGSHTMEADGTQHDVAVRVERDGDSKKLNVTLAYSRGGEDIIAPYSFDTKLKKREVVRIEGGLAIALTIAPKKVSTKKEEPKRKKPKLDTSEDPNDPLAGLE